MELDSSQRINDQWDFFHPIQPEGKRNEEKTNGGDGEYGISRGSRIGIWRFGYIYHVKEKWNGREFAMRCIPRKCFENINNKLEKSSTVYERLMNDMNIISKLKHPLISSVRRRYLSEKRDDFKILYDFIRSSRHNWMCRLSVEKVRKYASHMISVLSYMSRNGVEVREIHPECFVLDEEDNLIFVMIPINTRDVFQVGGGTTRTYDCDSNDVYSITPELMRGDFDECNFNDLPIPQWSLGLIISEMLTGSRPFESESSQVTQEWREQLVSVEKYKLPSSVENESVKHLVSRLLEKDPKRRISDYDEIKSHPFFAEDGGVDWQELEKPKHPRILMEERDMVERVKYVTTKFTTFVFSGTSERKWLEIIHLTKTLFSL